MAPAVTVGGLLNSRPEAMGLPLELLSGAGGLDRVITSPHIQKTGLALAGFDEYLQPGARPRVRRERSAVPRTPGARKRGFRRSRPSSRHDIPCVLITGGWEPPADLLAGAERAQVPLLRTAVATPLAIAKLDRAARRRAGRARGDPRRADGHPRAGRADRRGQRHRQERVRARPGRARPPAGGRRHRRDPPPRRDGRHRHLPGADAASHGGARPRRHQHPRSVRRRLDAHDRSGVELVVQLERWDPEAGVRSRSGSTTAITS